MPKLLSGEGIAAAPLVLLHLGVYGACLFWLPLELSLVAVGFAAVLIWISVTDIRAFEIPDTASLLLALSGLALMVGIPTVQIIEKIIAALLWPILFLAVAALYRKRHGAHGLGLGDVKLMVGLGLWLGLAGSIWAVLCAALGGIVTILVLGLSRSGQGDDLRQTGIAFGPFLCLSSWVIWLKANGI